MIENRLSLRGELKLSLNLLLRDKVKLLEVSAYELENFLRELSQKNPLCEGFYVKGNLERFEGDFFQNLAYEESFYQEFNRKIEESFTGLDLKVAKELFKRVEPSGFLKEGEIREVSKIFKLPLEEVERVRKRIMELEPYGVCSKDRMEFIKFQIEFLLKDEGLLRRFESCTLREEDKERIRKLRLNPIIPKPQTLYPLRADVVVEVDGENIYYYLYEENFHFRINEAYLRNLKGKKLKEFLREKLREVREVQTLLNLRREKLKGVVEKVIEVQREFFLYGKDLKPLLLSDLANELGVSLSSLSRLVSSKFVKTPFGTYRLRDFFVKGVCKELSQGELMELIRELIKEEDKEKPLSDERIAQILRGRGYKVSRRTVTKYRELLGIPPSPLRKKRV